MNGRCPICRTGQLLDCTTGVWCSRRYARRNACDFEAPLCDSPQQYRAYLRQWRKQKGLS